MKIKSGISGLTGRLKKRYHIVAILCVAGLAVIAGRLFWIEIFHGDAYAQAVLNRSRSSKTIYARRGDILDRNNVLLASSTMEYTLILDPVVLLEKNHDYLEVTATALARCFDLTKEEIREKAYSNPNSSYVVLKRNLTYADVKEFLELQKITGKELREELQLPDTISGADLVVEGAWLEESYKRNYPYGTLACSVLGFTEKTEDQTATVGIYGIEKYYNTELAGTDGIKYNYLNNDNVVESIYKYAEDGCTLQLTIDYNIQAIVQKHMMEMLEESGARMIAVTIQDPNTGEFLAMEDTGLFDPNNPRDLSARYSEYEESVIKSSDQMYAEVLTENWKNFCVTDTYEPGSTFKAFTVAGALESGCISENDYYNCDGSVQMLDYTIHCANIDGHGYISLTDALSESCNMALMDIAATEGIDLFCKYQSQFGFGSLTNIDLPTEMSCKTEMYTRETMSELDLATNSFGQNFNVTMVQMSSAFCSLVNGGTYYKPYIVKGIYNSNGELIQSAGKTVVSKPISEETGSFIKNALRHVVTDGTGPDAAVPGYIAAGKTGTAQKGDRSEDLWVASFIGFAPYEHPEVVCYVVIDEPASGGDGSSVYACELFSRIMSEVLPYLNAVPASMDTDPTGVGSPETTEAEEVYYED